MHAGEVYTDRLRIVLINELRLVESGLVFDVLPAVGVAHD